MNPFFVVIPARFASTRLPGKPLADIAGKPMVVRVAEQAAVSGAAAVIVATDHAGVFDTVRAAGFKAVMTSPDCASGTDRLAEVVAHEGWADDAIVVNVQGDEPLIDPALICATAERLAERPDAAMATVCHPLTDPAEVFNPNVVKVVLDARDDALLFSRAPIPWARDAWMPLSPGPSPTAGGGEFTIPTDLPVFRHVGLYAYRVGFLKTYPGLSQPALERLESLEQLRALWHGYRITVVRTEHASAPGVDTPEDLERVRGLFV